MKVTRIDPAARDAFLADQRLGILALRRASGEPTAIPLWYAWDGRQVAMVSASDSAKLRWLRDDPRACLLVTNVAPEPARWVSLEGRASLDPTRGREILELLARRYLPGDWYGESAAQLETLRRADVTAIWIRPDRIRTYAMVC